MMTNPMVLCSSGGAGFLNINPADDKSNGLRRSRAPNFSAYQKISFQFAASQSLLHLSMNSGIMQKRNLAVYNSIIPAGPPPTPPSSDSWNGWVVGIVISVILPILTKKCGALLLHFKNIEAAVDTAERIVEVVEKVSEQVEKVAEDILEELPAGKLKNLVSVIENVAERTGDSVEVVGDFIDKVQEVEEKVESIVEYGKNEESKNEKKKEEEEVSITDEGATDSKETGSGQPKPIIY